MAPDPENPGPRAWMIAPLPDEPDPFENAVPVTVWSSSDGKPYAERIQTPKPQQKRPQEPVDEWCEEGRA